MRCGWMCYLILRRGSSSLAPSRPRSVAVRGRRGECRRRSHRLPVYFGIISISLLCATDACSLALCMDMCYRTVSRVLPVPVPAGVPPRHLGGTTFTRRGARGAPSRGSVSRVPMGSRLRGRGCRVRDRGSSDIVLLDVHFVPGWCQNKNKNYAPINENAHTKESKPGPS